MERFEKITRVLTSFMGGSTSKLEKALGDSFPEGERYFGLENFGNTCYCNSVLQVLYFCLPFREHLLEYYNEHQGASTPESEESLLTCLAELFNQIASQKRRTGVVAPKRFVQKVKKQKELFRSYMHQDAHEFLNFLLNELADILEKEARARSKGGPIAELPANGVVGGLLAETPREPKESREAKESSREGVPSRAFTDAPGTSRLPADAVTGGAAAAAAAAVGGSGVGSSGSVAQSPAVGLGGGSPGRNGAGESNGAVGGAGEAGREGPITTWVHQIFQGTLTNETRCLCCETVTARDESFLDLSLDIEQNCSVTACLRNFSSTETLSGNDKFFCDTCCSLQEAQKRMRVKVPPRVLALHLKRFKYIEQLGRYKKLSYRVVFPLHLRLCNTVDDAPGAEAEYSLFAVIVHLGSGPNHGHYVSLVKSHDNWLYFDDETVDQIDESSVQTFFGSSQEFPHSNTDHGYFLFYECLQPELLHAQPQPANA